MATPTVGYRKADCPDEIGDASAFPCLVSGEGAAFIVVLLDFLLRRTFSKIQLLAIDCDYHLQGILLLFYNIALGWILEP